ncbi:substrate-binding domain-containing protein [Runella sp. CRIBMP]|uniref:LacI family DNA-binding transcriptional regulator n=1 Tax=Runella sp. CRIBMP TaxID=2683261 RepID=UPI001412F94A|nr:LacI family DNA-binding transcriptional regulator [Runella sp. CRIBMP]NBB21284.1 substrate-binding domain-containing protein [Runella sp. CRIBMP]
MNLKQLAKELNLSFSTVSKALRDSHEISTDTKKRVLAKAKELNYQVNPLASSFRKQKSLTIAVVIPEVVNDFFGPVINGIESIAQEKGYHVLIYLTHEDMQKEVAITQLLQNGRVDGIMMSLSEQTSETTHLEALKEKGIPLVFFDRTVDQPDAPKVTTDDYNCGIKATEHLIENGCKQIAFLSISQHLSISNKRMNGYLEALKKNNIKSDSALLVSCDSHDAKNNERIQELLKRENRPDGIFASVEKLAISTYKICEALRLNIPNDVKIITFSNSYTAPFLNPSLTTVTQPAYEMGREAAAVLFKLIEKKKPASPMENIVLNSVLIARNSTKSELAR